jgi:Phycobilisome Linker polypeptide
VLGNQTEDRIIVPKPSTRKNNSKDESKALIAQSIHAGYWDVLQREPSEVELNESMSDSLLTLDGRINFIRKLLCSAEFISRFVLAMSPMLLARVVINQVVGRAPISQDEINGLAAKMVGAGWLACVDTLLNQSTVRCRVLMEPYARVQRELQHSNAKPSKGAKRASGTTTRTKKSARA